MIITPIFAEFENIAPDWLRNAALFIAGAAATVYYIKEIFRGPRALDVKMIESLVTKTDFEKAKGELEYEDRVLHKRITDGRTEIDETLRNLPSEIVALLRNSGALK